MCRQWKAGHGSVPHFSTFGKNYTRHFKDTDLFEQNFSHILEQCMKFHLVDTSIVFVDSTHVKACANSKKMRKRIASQEALWYEEELKKEISEDRKNHRKKPLKEKKDDSNTPPTAGGGISGESSSPDGARTQKCSTSDPESGWFRKGEHKHVFAYSIETACGRHGWISGYTVHPGNEHDSRKWKPLYDKVKDPDMERRVLDAGYKTPAIARELLKEGIQPLFPYKRPMTIDGFFKKYEYVYDEYYHCYICPAGQILTYRTTNREGYKEYRSDKSICKNCHYLFQCTESKAHKKTISRYIWEEYRKRSDEYESQTGLYAGNLIQYQKRI